MLSWFGTIVPAGAQRKKELRARAAANAVTEKNLRLHIGYLAADSLEGRRTGTAGEEKAAAYIEAYYRRLGIGGAGAQGSYRQPFEVDEGKIPAKNVACRLNDHNLALTSEFFPMPWASSGTIQASSSVALLEGGSPWWLDLAETLDSNKNNPHFLTDAFLKEKATDAARKGATALLVYNSSNLDEGLRYNAKDRVQSVDIPVIFFTKAAVARCGIQEQASFTVAAHIGFEQASRRGINVAAYINRQAEQTIILGAHFDHLGYGEDANSRHTGDPAIHNGADDNASGTAAVMELGRILSARQNLPFNILLLHFSGEELGLYGSKFFTENPLINLKQVNYMINLDMVGRLNDSSKTLTIGGVGTSPQWASLLPLQQQDYFTFKVDSSGTGPSDHTSFYRKDLPVLFFFTGLHTDYHKPGDDADRINYPGTTAIVNLVAGIVEKTPQQQKLAFTKTREQSMGTGRFRVSMGIMPDYTYGGQGVKADGVIDGRAAQKAGLQTGDVIIQLGEHLVTGVDTYMQALNRFEKGQQTTVVVKRGNDIRQFDITF